LNVHSVTLPFWHFTVMLLPFFISRCTLSEFPPFASFLFPAFPFIRRFESSGSLHPLLLIAIRGPPVGWVLVVFWVFFFWGFLGGGLHTPPFPPPPPTPATAFPRFLPLDFFAVCRHKPFYFPPLASGRPLQAESDIWRVDPVFSLVGRGPVFPLFRSAGFSFLLRGFVKVRFVTLSFSKFFCVRKEVLVRLLGLCVAFLSVRVPCPSSTVVSLTSEALSHLSF